MVLAVSLPLPETPVADTVDVVRRATDLGYTAAWASEVAGPDFATLCGAVAATCDVDLGVAVVPVQTRAPWLLAATAVALSQLSGGRFTLGVGTSSEVIVDQWSGLPFDEPLAHLRESVALLRELFTGERVSFAGEHVRCEGYRLYDLPPARVPIVVGALNPLNLRQAGAIGDGVCLNQFPLEQLPRILDEVRAGTEAAGRPTDQPVIARLMCWATDDVEAAHTALRRTFAPYAATRAYNRFFRWCGFDEEMDAVLAAARAGDRAGMAAALSDRFVESVYLVGDDETVARRVRELLDAGVTTAIVAPLGQGPDGAWRTLSAAAGALG